MASYVTKTLLKDESILYEAKISWWTQWPLLLIGIVLLFAAGLGIIFLVWAYVRYKSTELAVTNKRVVAKFGFLSISTIEMHLSKIETVQVQQSMFGRLLNYGSLVVAGAGIPQEPIPGIADPLEFRRALMEAQEQARSISSR